MKGIKNDLTILDLEVVIEELSEKGHNFAKDFTVERFEDGWEKVLSV